MYRLVFTRQVIGAVYLEADTPQEAALKLVRHDDGAFDDICDEIDEDELLYGGEIDVYADPDFKDPGALLGAMRNDGSLWTPSDGSEPQEVR